MKSCDSNDDVLSFTITTQGDNPAKDSNCKGDSWKMLTSVVILSGRSDAVGEMFSMGLKAECCVQVVLN